MERLKKIDLEMRRLVDEKRIIQRQSTRCLRCDERIVDPKWDEGGDYYKGIHVSARPGTSSEFADHQISMGWDFLEYAEEAEKADREASLKRRSSFNRKLEDGFWLCDSCAVAFDAFLTTMVKGNEAK